MQNIYLQKVLCPFLLLLLILLIRFNSFGTESNRFPVISDIYTIYRIDVPRLQVKPSLVGANHLNWTTVSGATGYVLEMSNSGNNDSFVQLKTFDETERSFRHTGLYYSQKVYYRIKALNGSGESTYSSVESATTHPKEKVFNIMPLGDSNTEGGSSSMSTNEKVAYRSKLEHLLNASVSKSKYDFVGSQRSGSNYATDIDHAGFGGATIQNIADLLKNRSYGGTSNNQGLTYLQEYQPDIILLHIGTNDADGSDAAIARLEGILNEIESYETTSGNDVTVILAKIIKRVCYNDVFVYSPNCYTPEQAKATIVYNSKMETLAKKRQAAGDNLLLVDMQDGAEIIYKWANDGGDMADPLHPIMAGYNKMGNVWFAQLDKLLNVQVQTPPDTQAPETTIATKPILITNKPNATFTFTSNETNVVYLASIDGGSFIQVPTPYTVNYLADGSHTIQVKAKDAAGNIDATPATYTWTIDTKAPNAPVIINPTENTLSNNNKPTVSGTAEAGASITLYLETAKLGTTAADGNGNWSFNPSSVITDGVKKITAQATDAAGNTSNSSSIRKFTIDTKAPETTITSGPAALTNQNIAEFAFSSDETNVTYEVSLDGSSFKVGSNPFKTNSLSDGSHTLKVRATDTAGNVESTPATFTWTIDTQAPLAPVFTSITEDRGPKSDDQVTSDNSIILSGTAEAGSKVNLFKDGVEIGQATTNSSDNWTFDFTSTNLAQDIHAFTASATDAAGNTSKQSVKLNVTVDLSAANVVLTTAQKSPANSSFEVTVNFSEQVYGMVLSDFNVSNATISNLMPASSTSYKFTLTPSADGLVRVSLPANKVTDLAGNPNTGSETVEVEFDATKPQLSINSDAAAIVNASFTATITFSEEVTGFELNDISFKNASLSNFKVLNGTTYTVQVAPISDGEVTLQVSADKAVDLAGNGNVASAEFKRNFDKQNPTVKLSTIAPNPINKPFTVTINFSEPVIGFELTDIAVTNGAASTLSKKDEQTYNVVIIPNSSGEVRISIEADKVEDIATNGSLASNELKLTYDSSRPGITLNTDATTLTNIPFTVTLKLSEPVVDLNLSAITVSNATTSSLKKVNDLEYLFVVTPLKDGAVKVSVADNKLHDAATNGNIASNSIELIYDATAPANYSVTFAVELVDVTNEKNVTLDISGAEKGAEYAFSITSNNGNGEVTGSGKVISPQFSISDLNLSALQDGMLTVNLYLVDEAGNKGLNAKDQVEKLTKNITDVEVVATIKVPFKTSFEQVPLPEKVKVTYSNQEQENIKVVWEKGNYNGSVPKQYTLVGKLELAANTSNIYNKTASIVIEVEPNKAPTALALSSHTFKPNITPSEVIGTFSTTDPDDTKFTYTLVNGEGATDNDFFEILDNNQLHLRSNKGLYGKSDFSIRVESKDPYQNTITKVFSLTKTSFKPNSKIELVNAFSPDGDGINDTWVVPELRYYNSVEVEVYNRAGARLFHSLNPEEGWDGKSTDGTIVQGSYFYIIQIKDIGLVQKGVVTVLK